MAIVLLTAHCLFLHGSHNYSVCDISRTRSLFSCSLRCKLLGHSYGFTFVEHLQHPENTFNGHAKSMSKYSDKSELFATKSGRFQLGRENMTGRCYCLSRRNGLGFSVKLTGSNRCIFKTELDAQYGDECKHGQKCKGVAVSCIRGTCGCEAGYRYDKKKAKCSKLDLRFGDNCKQTDKCKGGSVSCIRGSCGCKEGYRYDKKKARCSKLELHFGDKCKQRDKCKGASVSCIHGSCGCKDGYIYDKERNKCKNIRRPYGHNCGKEHVCIGKGVECLFGLCRCQKHYVYIKKESACKERTRKHGESCKTGFECCERFNTCYKKKCVCKRGYSFQDTTNGCVRNAEKSRKLGESCQLDKDCQVKFSLCAKSTCRCKVGYIFDLLTNGCKQISEKSRKIGQNCKNDSECKGQYVVCYQNRCLCNPGYYLLVTLKVCVSTTGCMQFDQSMTAYESLGIKGHNDVVINPYPPDISRKEFFNMCKMACIYESGFTCTTADFIFSEDKKKCLLSEAGYLDVTKEEREVDQEDWIMFVRNCEF